MDSTEPPGTEHRDLIAPESLVLRQGLRPKPADVITLALLELTRRRVLRLAEVEIQACRGS